MLRGLSSALTLAGGLAGCAEPDERFVAWPAQLPELVFLVHTDGQRLLEARGPLSGAEPGLSRLELLDSADARWEVLGFELAELRAAVPELPPELEPSRVRLEPGTERCEQGRFSREADGHTRRLSVTSLSPTRWLLDPEALDWYRPTEEETPPLSLVVPEDTERCAAEVAGSSFRAFGATEALFQDVDTLGGRLIPTRAPWVGADFDRIWVGLHWVDEDTALGVTRNALHRLSRGAPLRDEPTHYFPLAEAMAPSFAERVPFIDGHAVDPRTLGTARVRILASVTALPTATNADDPTRLVELWLDDAGFSAPRELASSSTRIRSIVFEPSGRAVAVGAGGAVLVVDPNPEVAPRLSRVSDTNPPLLEIQGTLDPARPHLVLGESGLILLGDMPAARFEVVPPQELIGSALSGLAHHVTPEGAMIAGTRYVGGFLAWRSQQGWRAPAFRLPSAVVDCTSQADDCGLRQPASTSNAPLALSAQVMLFPMEECDAVFLLDLERGCGRGILREGAERAAPTARYYFRTHAIQGAQVLVGGDDGRLVELSLGAEDARR